MSGAHPSKKSVRAAKHLWRAKHGHFGRRFCQEIETLSVEADFTMASAIVGDFAEDIGITEESTEAYVAQSVLGRLLGKSTSSSSVVTNSIGGVRRDTRGRDLDYEFCWPEHTDKKLDYVFRSELFERIILANIHERGPRRRRLVTFIREHRSTQSTEVNFAVFVYRVGSCMSRQARGGVATTSPVTFCVGAYSRAQASC
jgi:hypothetical protein